MILRFFAREDILATVPDAPIALGQHIPRVGRTFVNGTMPATKEPHDVDTDKVSMQVVEAYKRMARFEDIWCADEATAAMCGVQVLNLIFKDGAYVRAPEKVSK